MPGETVGEAFVLIRPDTTGFQSAAESQVSAAGKALGKVFATAFAVGGVAEGVKSVVGAAAAHQAAFAVLSRTVKDAGASNTLYGKSLEDLLDKEARLKGFSDEDLASAFQRLVSVTHNSVSAFKLLGEAEDLARFRHIDVAQAALALSKAEQGSASSLQRYGITAVKVTTQADALKAKYVELAKEGAKLDPTQKAAYESALKQAEAHDKAASAAATLAEVEQRVGGSAAAFASTSQGQFDILGVELHQLKVSIGEDLLPYLTSGAQTLGRWFTELSANQGVQQQFKTGIQDAATFFHDLEDVLGAVEPPLKTVADDLGGVIRLAEIAAGALAAKKLTSGAESLYNKLTGAGSSAGSGGASVSLVDALAANTAATEANTVALGGEGALGAASGAAAGAEGGAAESIVARGFRLLGPAAAIAGLGYADYKLGQKALTTSVAGAVVPGAARSPYDKGTGLDDAYQAGLAGRTQVNGGPIPAHGPQAAAYLLGQTTANVNAAQVRAATSGLKTAAQQVAQSYAGALLTETTTGQAHATLTTAAKATIQTLADTVSTDQADLAQLKTNLADTVRQGAEAVNQAVQQAKQNLNTIGQDLATSVANVLNQPLTVAQQQLSDAQDKVTADYDRRAAALQGRSNQLQRESNALSLIGARQNLKQLSEGLVLPGGRPLSSNPAEATRQLEQLAKRSPADAALQQYILQYRQANLGVGQAQLAVRQTSLDQQHGAATTVLQLRGDALKLAQDLTARQQTAATRRINDLTDEANKGAITPTQLRNRITNVLTTYGITRSAAQRELGIAAADTLTGQLQGLGLQAAANAAGPQRAGTGLVPSLVKPLDTLRQTVKASADAQLSESKAQTKVLKDQAKYLKTLAGDKAAAKFTGSLARNPGQQTKTSKALVGVSG